MKQKMADMAYREAEKLGYLNVRGLMEIAYGLASLSANWYHNNVWHDVREDVGSNALILVLDENGHGTTTTREQLVRGYGEWGKGFCRWAYVEDLLPDIKEGGLWNSKK